MRTTVLQIRRNAFGGVVRRRSARWTDSLQTTRRGVGYITSALPGIRRRSTAATDSCLTASPACQSCSTSVRSIARARRSVNY